MKNTATKQVVRLRRRARVRSRVAGTAARPRLAVFKSNKYVYAQLIDDDKGVTLAAATALSKPTKGAKAKVAGMAGVERAKKVGLALAEKASAKKISTVVFDRGGYRYTGQIKAVADGAREGGLIF